MVFRFLTRTFVLQEIISIVTAIRVMRTNITIGSLAATDVALVLIQIRNLVD